VEAKVVHGIEEGLAFASDNKSPAVILVAKGDWAATLAEVVRLRARVDGLLEANNRLVEANRRARNGLFAIYTGASRDSAMVGVARKAYEDSRP
jgi:hypothetical protein